MINRTYHIRANRRGRLEGEQLDIRFPRRGRPTRIRVLERCGQMRLNLLPQAGKRALASGGAAASPAVTPPRECFDDALQMTFPVRPMTEDELRAEFDRLFPAEGC